MQRAVLQACFEKGPASWAGIQGVSPPEEQCGSLNIKALQLHASTGAQRMLCAAMAKWHRKGVLSGCLVLS